MSLKSFFTDFKKIGSLYSFFIFIEIALTFVLLIVLDIISSIVLLPFIFIVSFIGVQMYMYYEFQRRLIRKVYDPEFKKNKNIIIFMSVSIVIMIFFFLYFIGFIISIISNPIFIFKFIKSLDTIRKTLDKIRFFSYLISIFLIGLYTFLLFDIKKIKKILFISLSFFAIEVILSLLLRNVVTSVIYLIAYGLSFFSWFGVVIFIFILLVFITFLVTAYKTILIQLVKYFKGENIIESKLNQLIEKIKDLLKIK